MANCFLLQTAYCLLPTEKNEFENNIINKHGMCKNGKQKSISNGWIGISWESFV